jgi:hypothetical protein
MYIAPATLARIIVTKNKRNTGDSSGRFDSGCPIKVMGLILQPVAGFMGICHTNMFDIANLLCYPKKENNTPVRFLKGI